jgi:hypothetical protein
MLKNLNNDIMKKVIALFISLVTITYSFACDHCKLYDNSPDFKIKSAHVAFNKKFGVVEFVIEVEGVAGRTTPKPAGKLNGAPVLGYVFPTTLKSEDVGFNKTEGIVALALTAHPDFDDSPLWDENGDGIYNNDGIVWHPHWVVLVKDERVKGGLAVKEFDKNDKQVKLPTTAPDMPMYMDSPGFPVVTEGNAIRVTVPAYRMNNKTSFNYDAVACYMEVSAPEEGHGDNMKMPMLGVYNVYSVLSKNLSLPYSAK